MYVCACRMKKWMYIRTKSRFLSLIYVKNWYKSWKVNVIQKRLILLLFLMVCSIHHVRSDRYLRRVKRQPVGWRGGRGGGECGYGSRLAHQGWVWSVASRSCAWWDFWYCWSRHVRYILLLGMKHTLGGQACLGCFRGKAYPLTKGRHTLIVHILWGWVCSGDE